MWNCIVAVPAVIVIDLVAILLFGLMGAAVASILVAALFFALNYRSVARDEPALGAAATWTRSLPTRPDSVVLAKEDGSPEQGAFSSGSEHSRYIRPSLHSPIEEGRVPFGVIDDHRRRAREMLGDGLELTAHVPVRVAAVMDEHLNALEIFEKRRKQLLARAERQAPA